MGALLAARAGLFLPLASVLDPSFGGQQIDNAFVSHFAKEFASDPVLHAQSRSPLKINIVHPPGAQHTPAKKWLTSAPIGLFMISTHYTRCNLWPFTLQFCAPRNSPPFLFTAPPSLVQGPALPFGEGA
ncbi:unnamed protein product [Tilletia caries]|uniref:Uncharacterized protein n=1 Tax=Tilletia caries TaxID=13290 RepID=A0ABN7IGZ8_9BASI|nr:unnamed protein product [Tilletia caries]CAD7064164.1 unnamed protein product [Tilletia caries]